jgi:hypothetical protein
MSVEIPGEKFLSDPTIVKKFVQVNDNATESYNY